MHSPVFSYLCGHDLNTLIGAMREEEDNTRLFGKQLAVIGSKQQESRLLGRYAWQVC